MALLEVRGFPATRPKHGKIGGLSEGCSWQGGSRSKAEDAGEAARESQVMIDMQSAINKGARSDNEQQEERRGEMRRDETRRDKLATHLRMTGSPLFCC